MIFGTGRKKGEALFDRIKYDGPRDGSPWLVYKYPGEQFVLGSQLIVNQGQEALFFKGGEALDLFGAGTHTLETGNLPLLHKLANLPFGGNTPFSAEIYYINKTSKLNMNWGTANPFSIEDPIYGLILSIRCHGTYGLRIDDARMFITELIGAVPSGATVTYEFAASYFSGLLTSKIKNVISAYMIRRKLSFLEVTSYLDEISSACEEALRDEFDRFGAELVNFYVETIKPPKDEYEKLRQYKEAQSCKPRQDKETGRGSAGNACPHCGTGNPPGQKFCGECGAKLVKKCPACGKKANPSQKFCGECGSQL